MTYKLTLTEQDCKDIGFVGNRYAWAESLYFLDAGEHDIPEHQAWKIKEAFETDTEIGHSFFPLLDRRSDLFEKLMAFYDSIV